LRLLCAVGWHFLHVLFLFGLSGMAALAIRWIASKALIRRKKCDRKLF